MFTDFSFMTWALVLIATVAVLAVFAVAAKPKPRFLKKRFLTENEARVLTLLEAALPQYRIMAQVAMGALLKSGEADRKQAQSTRNRFAQKVVDYVVVRRDTAEVVALIELDDRTHSSAKDARRDAMTANAGYRTIRIPGRPRPTVDSVRVAVAELQVPVSQDPQRQICA